LDGGLAIAGLEAVSRELALLACVGFLIGGADDLLLDIVYWWRGRHPTRMPDIVAPPRRLAIFLPAWDEASVIDRMLASTFSRLNYHDYRIYVGVYPNDRATMRAVASVMRRDQRIHMVVNSRPGPTTKADNLNSLWRALCRDEVADGWRAGAIILHDAEDVVHPDELTVFDRMLADYAVVQLPVVPLIAPGSRWVSAHYSDEFAEAHAHGLAVRSVLGARLPLAGVGCAVRRDVFDDLCAIRPDGPFDATSLVEDYEFGLSAVPAHHRGCFARVRDELGRLVCVQAYFPATVAAAARQKARWMAGIALIGWDRLGWSRPTDLIEHWMRMRDRRGPLTVLMLMAAYLSLVVGILSAGLHLATGLPPTPMTPLLTILLAANTALLAWRLAMRATATGSLYGWREGLRAMPRMIVANFIALLAARRALAIYADDLRGRTLRWDKTAHAFPSIVAD
jgi:adsorption protein B